MIETKCAVSGFPFQGEQMLSAVTFENVKVCKFMGEIMTTLKLDLRAGRIWVEETVNWITTGKNFLLMLDDRDKWVRNKDCLDSAILNVYAVLDHFWNFYRDNYWNCVGKVLLTNTNLVFTQEGLLAKLNAKLYCRFQLRLST